MRGLFPVLPLPQAAARQGDKRPRAGESVGRRGGEVGTKHRCFRQTRVMVLQLSSYGSMTVSSEKCQCGVEAQEEGVALFFTLVKLSRIQFLASDPDLVESDPQLTGSL